MPRNTPPQDVDAPHTPPPGDTGVNTVRINTPRIVQAVRLNAVNPTVTRRVIVRESLYTGTGSAELVDTTETGVETTTSPHGTAVERHVIRPREFLAAPSREIKAFLDSPPTRRDVRAQLDADTGTDGVEAQYKEAVVLWERTAREHVADTVTIDGCVFTVVPTA